MILGDVFFGGVPLRCCRWERASERVPCGRQWENSRTASVKRRSRLPSTAAACGQQPLLFANAARSAQHLLLDAYFKAPRLIGNHHQRPAGCTSTANAAWQAAPAPPAPPGRLRQHRRMPQPPYDWRRISAAWERPAGSRSATASASAVRSRAVCNARPDRHHSISAQWMPSTWRGNSGRRVPFGASSATAHFLHSLTSVCLQYKQM